jgi:hypothetical protein
MPDKERERRKIVVQGYTVLAAVVALGVLAWTVRSRS